ncbi:hypothetical protein C8Q79DRAFT_918414 [Trametes meyenii]|nr:hypothetical protein C8Q79DRAFT_918414 [Trametes meyenii]
MALHAIVTKALPSYRTKLAEMLHNPRDGRATALTDHQAALKHAWERLYDVPIKGEYVTDVAKWTCDCGAQKYHTHILCKHLVRAVGRRLPADWWPIVERFHIPPFYLVPEQDGSTAAAPEHMRDHDWVPRMQQHPAIIRHPARAHAKSSEDGSPFRLSDLEFSDNELADIPSISSSPDRGPHTGPDGIFRERAGGGAGYELEDADDVEANDIERLLAEAIKILPAQSENPNQHFVRTSIKVSLRGTFKWVCERDNKILPDLETLSTDAATELLKRALELFQDHCELARGQGGPRYLRDAKARVRGLVRWVRAVEYEESRYTMRRTNVRQAHEPDPTILIGYMYRER